MVKAVLSHRVACIVGAVVGKTSHTIRSAVFHKKLATGHVEVGSAAHEKVSTGLRSPETECHSHGSLVKYAQRIGDHQIDAFGTGAVVSNINASAIAHRIRIQRGAIGADGGREEGK